MAKIYKYADSLSETHFFYAFPKENRLFFAKFDHKKMGRTLSRIPFFIFHERGLFLPSHRFAIIQRTTFNCYILFSIRNNEVKILTSAKCIIVDVFYA